MGFGPAGIPAADQVQCLDLRFFPCLRLPEEMGVNALAAAPGLLPEFLDSFFQPFFDLFPVLPGCLAVGGQGFRLERFHPVGKGQAQLAQKGADLGIIIDAHQRHPGHGGKNQRVQPHPHLQVQMGKHR